METMETSNKKPRIKPQIKYHGLVACRKMLGRHLPHTMHLLADVLGIQKASTPNLLQRRIPVTTVPGKILGFITEFTNVVDQVCALQKVPQRVFVRRRSQSDPTDFGTEIFESTELHAVEEIESFVVIPIMIHDSIHAAMNRFTMMNFKGNEYDLVPNTHPRVVSTKYESAPIFKPNPILPVYRKVRPIMYFRTSIPRQGVLVSIFAKASSFTVKIGGMLVSRSELTENGHSLELQGLPTKQIYNLHELCVEFDSTNSDGTIDGTIEFVYSIVNSIGCIPCVVPYKKDHLLFINDIGITGHLFGTPPI